MLARPAGLEPATPGLEGRCSIQLSYGRVSFHRIVTGCAKCYPLVAAGGSEDPPLRGSMADSDESEDSPLRT